MKGTILLAVWLVAISRASAAPLDLQTEPGLPDIVASIVAGDESPAIEFFTHENGRQESESLPVALLLAAGALGMASSLGVQMAGQHLRHSSRRHVERRCVYRRRQMAGL